MIVQRLPPGGDARREDPLRVTVGKKTLEELFEERYSVQFASYPVREPWLLEPARTIAAQAR